jgi:hypothetical protein
MLFIVIVFNKNDELIKIKLELMYKIYFELTLVLLKS